MDKVEAKLILEQELLRYRKRSYDELLSLIDHSETFLRSSPSGTNYQIQMKVFFDNINAQRDLRVMGAVDDGGWRAFIPLCEDFIIAPDGSFVDE
ncbi:MAG: hypothetical protein H0U54_19780 [Acidobacteria bacterium]|nr:hypothetical protein [Acidobacteriota bacterium]